MINMPEPKTKTKEPEVKPAMKEQTSPKLVELPEILVIGAPKDVRIIEKYIEYLSVQLRQSRRVERAVTDRYADFSAVVLVQGDRSQKWLNQQLLKLSSISIPCMVVVNPAPNITSMAVRMYAMGADIVFCGDHGIADIPRYISMFLNKNWESPTKSSDPLVRALEYRINLEPHFINEELIFDNEDGDIKVRGILSAVWKWQFLDKLLSDVPGVKSVSMDQLILNARPLKNSITCEYLWGYFQSDSHVSDETLMVSADEDNAIVSGVVSRRRDIQPVLEELEEDPRIEEVSPFVIESLPYQKACKKRARKIYKKIERLKIPHMLRVSVCGAKVGLSGCIGNGLVLDRVIGACLSDPETEYVLNTCVVSDDDYAYASPSV